MPSARLRKIAEADRNRGYTTGNPYYDYFVKLGKQQIGSNASASDQLTAGIGYLGGGAGTFQNVGGRLVAYGAKESNKYSDYRNKGAADIQTDYSSIDTSDYWKTISDAGTKEYQRRLAGLGGGKGTIRVTDDPEGGYRYSDDRTDYTKKIRAFQKLESLDAQSPMESGPIESVPIESGSGSGAFSQNMAQYGQRVVDFGQQVTEYGQRALNFPRSRQFNPMSHTFIHKRKLT